MIWSLDAVDGEMISIIQSGAPMQPCSSSTDGWHTTSRSGWTAGFFYFPLDTEDGRIRFFIHGRTPFPLSISADHYFAFGVESFPQKFGMKSLILDIIFMLRRQEIDNSFLQ